MKLLELSIGQCHSDCQHRIEQENEEPRFQIADKVVDKKVNLVISYIYTPIFIITTQDGGEEEEVDRGPWVLS